MVDEKVTVQEPTQEWIEEKKKKHGKVMRVVLSGNAYYYRPLKRSEYKELQKIVSPEMTPNGPMVPTDQQNKLEEDTAKLCVLWPEKLSDTDMDAGVPSMLATYISDASGFLVDEVPQEL